MDVSSSPEKNASPPPVPGDLDRPVIAFFGCRNAGKSSLVNAVTGQPLSVVSAIKGTTTDPVRKAMELLPLGPVFIIDTPGFDDAGELGEKRVEKARRVLDETDAAVLVVDATQGLRPPDEELLRLMRTRHVPCLLAYNKADILGHAACDLPENAVLVSAKTGQGVETLKEALARLVPSPDPKLRLVADLLTPGDLVVLVTPIDKSAPKGRLILPQQQVIRDVLEADAAALVVKEHELRQTLALLKKPPALVVTDSQVFNKADADVPPEVPLTSFSILFARYKGFLDVARAALSAFDKLPDGAVFLIAEGCTHHRQCDDIGTVKLPRWIRAYTGKSFDFHFCVGRDFPDEAALSGYDFILHCGGCMLGGRALHSRVRAAVRIGVPFCNYGLLIAHLQGITQRALACFPLARADSE
jgi:[FeFe] hydrogenase H-cluster maturation GTPase HydF